MNLKTRVTYVLWFKIREVLCFKIRVEHVSHRKLSLIYVVIS
jgi:hypothetical protein